MLSGFLQIIGDTYHNNALFTACIGNIWIQINIIISKKMFVRYKV